MGVFDRFRQDKPGSDDSPMRKLVCQVFQDEGIPLDEELVQQVVGECPRIRIFRCTGDCGEPVLLHLGDTDPPRCYTCGSVRQEVQIELPPLEGKERAILAAQGHYAYALLCCRREDLATAERSLTRAITLKPDFADAYYNRSELRIGAGNLAGAIEDCTEALRLHPEDSGAYVNRGSAKAQQGDYQGCIDDTSRAIELGCDKPIAFFNRGMCYVELERSPEARRDFERFLESAPPTDPRAAMVRMLLNR